MEKPNMMESVQPCSGEYSLKKDLRLNIWLGVAVAVYLASLVVLRTHPEERAGCYFLLRVANGRAPVTVKLQLTLVTPTSAKPATFSFPVDLKSGDTVINVGLTGTDWPDKKANPVAWKIDLLGADGQSLAAEASYLWEKPRGN